MISATEDQADEAQALTAPIFPLPSVQLFPHALLPLHIFEPRYRQMLADCLAGERRMVIATLSSEHATAPVAGVQPVCGLGEIVAHEPTPDGRSNILLRGLGRYRLLAEQPSQRLYRLATIAPLVERADDEPRLQAAHHQLVVLTERLSRLLPSGGPTLQKLLASQSSTGPLADVLAAALVTDSETRQTLLETLDIALRTERLTAEIASLVATLHTPTTLN